MEDTGGFTAKDMFTPSTSTTTVTATSFNTTEKTVPATKPRVGAVKKPALVTAGSRSGSGKTKMEGNRELQSE
jgi:hypothetical protein